MRTVLVLPLVFAACGEPRAQERVQEGQETPQAAVAALRRAYERRSGDAYLALIEPLSREELLNSYLVAQRLLSSLAPEPDATKETSDLWRRYGIQIQPAGAFLDGTLHVPSHVDRGVLMGEILEFFAKHSLSLAMLAPYPHGPIAAHPESSPGVTAPAAWRLEDLQTTGDAALAKVVARMGEYDVENFIRLKRIGDRWFVTPRRTLPVDTEGD